MFEFALGNATVVSDNIVPDWAIDNMRAAFARAPFEVCTFESDSIVSYWDGTRESCELWLWHETTKPDYPDILPSDWFIRERTPYDILCDFGYGYELTFGHVSIR